MITVDLHARPATAIRWAVSPVLETLGWLRLTRDGVTDPTYGAPQPATRELLDSPDVALTAELLPSADGSTPDFLVPTPPAEAPARAAELQFARIQDTDPAQAAVEVWEALGDRRPSTRLALALHDGTLPTRVAQGLETFWERGMHDVFERADSALRVEIDRCAQLADGGIGAVLNLVHERLTGEVDDLEVDPQCSESAPPGVELLVIPTALRGRRLAMRLWGDEPFVAYPIGTRSSAAESIAGLRRLLGPTRAAILRHLASARTTTELSDELRLAAATVSYHVKVMQRAGLLERSRHRHNVFYELSPTGRQLLSSLP